jgi:predicted HAD superfamily hydrolase
VFDTCVFRGHAFPSDVCSELARRLLGETASADEIEDFKATRIEAERRARAASEHKEITLEDIWHELCRMFQGLEQNYGIETEIVIEESGFLANAEMLGRAQEVRASRAVVSGALKRLGFALEGDRIYISSECKVTKWSGKLFLQLLQQEGVASTDVWHVEPVRWALVDLGWA